MIKAYKLKEKEILYEANIFDFAKYTVELPNGKESTRYILEHNGAAVIIAIAKNGDLVMVRQYRNGSGSVMLELPAGKLDLGEDPQVCALRELTEETGYRAAKIKKLLNMYPVAAYCTEQMFLFLAEELEAGQPSPDEDEFVEVELQPLAELLCMIDRGEITDMKTILGLLYYSRMLEK